MPTVPVPFFGRRHWFSDATPGTVEKGDRHRAATISGGFDIDPGSEPVPFFHSTRVNTESKTVIPMRRHLIGIISLVLFVGAMVSMHYDTPQFTSACSRVGALMAVLWLAYKELQRLPERIWRPLLLAALVLAIRPKLILWAIPLIIILAILKPRFGRRSKGDGSQNNA